MTHRAAADVLDQLEKRQSSIHKRIDAAISRLAFTQSSANVSALKGKPYLRLRIGGYRVIFHYDHDVGKLYILDVGARKNIYRP